MSALYRFGFEGGYTPNGVMISGSYMLTQGRSGVSSSAVAPVDTAGATIVVDSKEPSNEIYITEHVKFNTYGFGTEVNLVTFGSVKIGYSLSNLNLVYRVNNLIVYQSPQVSFPAATFIPIGHHILLGSSGSIMTTIDALTYTYNGNTLNGSTDQHPIYIYLGMGSVGSSLPQLIIDDIAINNGVSHSNSTGSYGSDDIGLPKFIRGLRTTLSSTGSIFQWGVGDTFVSSNVMDIVNGNVDSYLITHKYNNIATFKATPIDPISIISFEGVNVFVNGVTVIEGTQVYFNSYFEDTASISINQSENSSISTLPTTTKYSAAEKDLGGKMTVDDFNSGSLVIVTRAYINQNYFGVGLLGDISITGSSLVPTNGDFTFLDYQNLIVTSGSILSTSQPCRGLIIYVRENCVIEGTISMDGRGYQGDITDIPVDVWRNTASFAFESASNSPSTWNVEVSGQPYISNTSSWVGLNQFTAPEIAGLLGSCGGGAAGGSSSFTVGSITTYASGGIGGSSSLWGGGCGGGGAITTYNGNNAIDYAVASGSSVQNGPDRSGGGGAHGGGVIYLFVGGNLVMGPQSKISSTGSNGTNVIGASTAGGGGGAGGGSINVFYGTNFYNLSGSFDVSGGKGSLGVSGGTNGINGSSGSIRLFHLLSN